jgi:hypothetical protein
VQAAWDRPAEKAKNRMSPARYQPIDAEFFLIRQSARFSHDAALISCMFLRIACFRTLPEAVFGR